MDCVNLRERFGRTFRVEYEESYYAQYGPHARVEIPVVHATSFPAEPAISSRGEPRLWPRPPMAGDRPPGSWAPSPGVKLWQDGSDGVTVLFPAERFPRWPT